MFILEIVITNSSLKILLLLYNLKKADLSIIFKLFFYSACFKSKIKNKKEGAMIIRRLLPIFAGVMLIGSQGFTAAASNAADTQSQTQAAPEQTVNDADLMAAALASENWLKLIDDHKYGESWDASSRIMQGTIKRAEWVQAMDSLRKPFGKVTSRTVLDQRTAKDPKGLPQGDYMVMFYSTNFANKQSAHELVTLFKEGGTWKVLTYQVN